MKLGRHFLLITLIFITSAYAETCPLPSQLILHDPDNLNRHWELPAGWKIEGSGLFEGGGEVVTMWGVSWYKDPKKIICFYTQEDHGSVKISPIDPRVPTGNNWQDLGDLHICTPTAAVDCEFKLS